MSSENTENRCPYCSRVHIGSYMQGQIDKEKEMKEKFTIMVNSCKARDPSLQKMIIAIEEL